MSDRKFLIAPLDWGLGHATRCAPIIESLIDLGAAITIAGSGLSYRWLMDRFSQLKFRELPNFPVTYPANGQFYSHFSASFLSMHAFLKEEQRNTEKIVAEEGIDFVISDNRYGVYSKEKKSILITHQLKPQLGMLKYLIQPYLNHKLNKFNELWVPDTEDSALAGKLSARPAGLRKPLYYLGPLSHLKSKADTSDQSIDVLIILSGPEPSRTNMEMTVMKQFSGVGGKCVVVGGTDKARQGELKRNIEYLTMVNSNELEVLIGRAEKIICSAGYSNIMDLSVLGKSAIIIPTEGQPEQEYLVSRDEIKSRFLVRRLRDLNLETDLDALEHQAEVTALNKSDLGQLINRL